uniref:NADH-ubiquinone oxidoreductase chain 3 n=1 Tax=Pholoe pallida TaxID=328599 RepID=A0A343W6L5_9ANNE|nr:NADH dehydrogenase subunit 3 [Pholoe pallida]
MTISIFITVGLPLIILLSALLLSARSTQDREKMSPFECGFDPKMSARIPFSLRFFLLAVIFLVFDIEIILLLPYPLLLIKAPAMLSIFTALLFFLILIVGLMHEWREGSLDWAM